MEKGKINIKISIITNFIITILTILASIIMYTGLKFMSGYDPILEATKIGMFRFFTVDSNVFMGVIALLFAIEEIKVLNGKIDQVSTKIYILKLMATTSVGLTFLTVFGYLGPIAKGGISSMLMNSNLFFHLLIPVISIINFIVFERTGKLKFKYSFLGVIPEFIYSIYYISNILIHLEEGKVSPIYDWYWFVQGGIWQAFIVLPLMMVITYIISLTLWRLNREKSRN